MWWFNYHVRRFFRSVMSPIREDVAKKWHRRMQLLYIFSAWNFAGFIFYKLTRTSNIENVSGEERYRRMAKNFNYKEAVAYRYRNGTLEKFEIDLRNDPTIK